MITEATVSRANLTPELLPDAQVVDISSEAEASPPLLELRRYPGKLLRLADIAVTRDPQVQMRLRTDKLSMVADAGAMLDLLPNSFQIPSANILRYNLYASAAKTDFRTSFGLWVQEPTVADKLKMGMSLTREEKDLNGRYGVTKSVEKGILPLPVEEIVQREYKSQLIGGGVQTYGRTQTVDTSGAVVDTMYPGKDEFLVLTGISATAGTAANNIRLYVSRDTDTNHVSDLKTYPVGLNRTLDTFIPALDEIRIEALSDEAAGVTVSVKYTIWKCRLSNLLKCRWGLISKEEAPGEIYEKVKAGIL